MDDKADYKKQIKEKMNNPQWRLGVVVFASFLNKETVSPI
jgi:hypothetical protein